MFLFTWASAPSKGFRDDQGCPKVAQEVIPKIIQNTSRSLRVLSAKMNTDLTIILRARMGSESIAHEGEGRMGY